MGNKRRASLAEPSDASDVEVSRKSAKKSKNSAIISPSGKDDEGNPFWELSSKRRVGVSEYKGMYFINIREYYDKDGKMLPGKKGISLTLEQYTALLKAAPAINSKLGDLGQTVDAAGEVEGIAPAISKKKKKKIKSEKSNIEATSDEED